MIKEAISYCLQRSGGATPTETVIHEAACVYSKNHFEYSLVYISLYNYFYK